MPPSKLSSGWDTEGALTREELDPTFAFPQFYEVSMFPSHKKASRNYVQPAVDSPRYNYRCAIDDVPSAYEYHRVQKQQEQRQRPKPSPLSPSVSLCSTYGRKPMCEAPNLGRIRIVVLKVIELREEIWDRQYGLITKHLFLNQRLRRKLAVKM
ncbi:hypothetical protein H4I96_08998 [Botrytis cinerea]